MMSQNPAAEESPENHTPCCADIASLLPKRSSAEKRHQTTKTAGRQAESEAQDLTEFFDKIERGLPQRYFFHEESRTIFHENTPPDPICGPIRVVSEARRCDRSGWATEVEYLDADDTRKRTIILKGDLLSGRGPGFAHLLDTGLVFHAGRSSVATVLKRWRNTEHSWRTDAAGWFRDPAGHVSFVEADGRVHQPAEPNIDAVVHAQPIGPRMQPAGSLDGWQREVATLAIGNLALVFAISSALAGPLLRWGGIETAGFNLYGPSSSGKSLMLRLALSCSGPPKRLMPWAAAASGLHRLSAASQDGLLTLDAFPRDADAKLLKALLAIGDDAASGRILADQDPDGGQRWRRVLLSASELPLSRSLARKKKDVPSALATRLIDIPADHAPHGLVADLHGSGDGRTFARRLDEATQCHHGHLLGAFLERLVEDVPELRADLADRMPALTRDIQDHPSMAASLGRQPAVAERFALVAYAGELAIRFGLLPWPTGTARDAALELASRAHNRLDAINGDIEHSVGMIRDYIDRNAERIADLDLNEAIDIPPDAVGWKDENNIYLLKQPVEEELDDADTLWSNLAEADILKPGGEKRSLQSRMPASKVRGRPRCYRLDSDELAKD
ncbi:DUF927 domain-containing protein [Paracoccus sp. TK19116]|uniref:DUF927 domain-containing protein n=1 Tax=Paracoccus albicereus TaxID=2922394 RepID=A0ABT1MWS5_9RHOB|nr:DUF927 domain-containing protein [Paracoccus albicereus]MCQ0971961.1 DUF927 domain-containing protein [Paracoccus albicereus]